MRNEEYVSSCFAGGSLGTVWGRKVRLILKALHDHSMLECNVTKLPRHEMLRVMQVVSYQQ